MKCPDHNYKFMLPATTPWGWGGVGVNFKSVFASKSMICSDLYRKGNASNYHVYRVGGVGGKVYKILFAGNCMKCSDLHNNVPTTTLIHITMGVVVKRLASLCRSEHYMHLLLEGGNFAKDCVQL